jgi:ubiquinone biosynthesis protein
MKVISTATNIGQAFKNAARVREILVVFVVHGFADLLHRMKLSRFLPGRYAENPRYTELPPPVRLRLSFEELGPTFVKLGQLLATRPDVIPEAFVEEFQQLQDNVKTVPFDEIRRFIEAELGRPISEVFASFDETPMAAASIAQVHGAELKSGERVAVKVQRPGIERLILSDVSILRGLALLLEKYVPETRPFNPSGVVEEFFKTILYELDFLVEANNIKRMKKNLESLDRIAIPKVYSEYSTGRVLVLERFEGVRFSDRVGVIASGMSPSEIVEAGARAFFHMVMRDGLFHGDLHPGNLFILPDGRIGIIDFGIVGRLSRRVQDSIIVMFTAMMSEDYETLASEYVTLCQETGPTDLARLQKDLMDTISPYMGMSLGEVNVGKILLSSTSIAVRHMLIVPRELLLLFKALVTIEAMGKKLDPHFDMMQVGLKLAKDALTTRYSKERLTRDLLVMARDLQSSLETVPRMLKLFLKHWSQNSFALETKSRDVRAVASAMTLFTYYFIVGVAATGLFALGITILVLDKGPMFLGLPLWTLLSLGSGFLLLAQSLLVLRRRLKE